MLIKSLIDGSIIQSLLLSAVNYEKLGCYLDKSDRAILSLEGTTAILDEHYRNRDNPVEKCYKAALSNGYRVFALQDGGQCMGSPTAESDYKKYGESTACSGGKGGPLANDVYQINLGN